MHLWDLKVKKYSAFGPFTRYQKKKKKKMDRFVKDRKLSHIAKNRIATACFQHDFAYANINMD